MASSGFSGDLLISATVEGGSGQQAAAEADAGAPPLTPRHRPLPPATPVPPALPRVTALREGARSQGERNLDAGLIALFEGFNHPRSLNLAECRVLNNHPIRRVKAAASGYKESPADQVPNELVIADRLGELQLDPDANYPGQGGQEGTGSSGSGAGGAAAGGGAGGAGGGGGGSSGGGGGGGGGGNNIEAEFWYNEFLTYRCMECQMMIAGWGCHCLERYLCTECRNELQGRPGILCTSCNTEVRDDIDFEMDHPAGMLTVTTHRPPVPPDPADAPMDDLPAGHHHPGPPWEYTFYCQEPGGPDLVPTHQFVYTINEGAFLAYVYRQ